jgi:predicted hydrolase (HD superfamily)
LGEEPAAPTAYAAGGSGAESLGERSAATQRSGTGKWEVAGILHDADWDQWPDEHCRRIIEHLEPDTDPQLLHAIASHSPKFFGVEPASELDHMLYAFDELSGFIHAVSLVRPDGYEGMKVKSVKKKMKEKSFAAQVDREDIADAASRIGPELDELIQFVIDHQAAVKLE